MGRVTTVDGWGQPVGDEVDWSGARRPRGEVLRGRHVRLEPLTEHHVDGLLDLGAHPRLWTYLSMEPPADRSEALRLVSQDDGVAYAVVDPASGRFLGRASYLRVQPQVGSIEVGAVMYLPVLQRTRGATEVQLLLARHAFEDLGYRRYEWKCDSLNAPSRRAALRLGFEEEGTWRQAMVVKGRNRDTTWFAITDRGWPRVRAAMDAWLDDANHDAAGRQRRTLTEVRAGLVEPPGSDGPGRPVEPG